MLDEGADAALEFEHIALVGAFIAQGDAHAGVQERQLTQSFGEDVVVELDVGERLRAGLEADNRARRLRVADRRQRRLRDAMDVKLPVLLAAPVDFQQQGLGQGIDDRDAHAMQTARHLVGIVVKLAAGMQHGHDDLGR